MPPSGPQPRLHERKPRVVAARDPLEHLIAKAACDALGVPVPALDTPLFDSPHATARAPALADAIAHACDVRLPAGEVASAGTVREIAHRVRVQGHAAFAQCWRRGGPNTSGVPVFYVHGDPNGGGAYCKGLAAALGPDIALHVLASHGPLGPAPLTDIPGMAAFHIQTLRAVQPQGPYRLAGFCLGGIVAFEMARQLEAQGDRVAALEMIGPTLWTRYFGLRRACAWTARRLGLSAPREEAVFFAIRDRVQPWFARLDRWRAVRRGLDPRRLPPAARLRDWPADWLNTRLGRHTRVSRERRRVHDLPADPRERARVEFWDAVVRMVRASVLQPWPGRVQVLWPERERPFRLDDPHASWAPLAGELHVKPVPGDHTGCLVWHVQALAEAMRPALLEGAEALATREGATRDA